MLMQIQQRMRWAIVADCPNLERQRANFFTHSALFKIEEQNYRNT